MWIALSRGKSHWCFNWQVSTDRSWCFEIFPLVFQPLNTGLFSYKCIAAFSVTPCSQGGHGDFDVTGLWGSYGATMRLVNRFREVVPHFSNMTAAVQLLFCLLLNTGLSSGGFKSPKEALKWKGDSVNFVVFWLQTVSQITSDLRGFVLCLH